MSNAYWWKDPHSPVVYKWDGDTTITSEVTVNGYKTYKGKFEIGSETAEEMDRIQDFIVGYRGPPLGMDEMMIEQIKSERPTAEMAWG